MSDSFKELHDALTTDDSEDSTPTKPKAQPIVPKNTSVVTLKHTGNIDYDPDAVQEFINFVFHKKNEDENILTWAPKTNRPSFPSPLKSIMNKLKNTNMPRAFYFGTATAKADVSGELRNRKDLFMGLHVVVLDDIGTKIPFDRIPEDLVPNYKIETSEGNFQYGLILDEPIRDLALADALIHLVYTSGLSDGGGKLPNKLVRLPCGINGKEGSKGEFRVRLTEKNLDYWTPSELLEVMDVGVKWEDIEKDIDAAHTGDAARKVGTSLWSPIKALASSLNGVVDPLLEWLYEEKKVANDNGGWVTVECPWCAAHTSGGNTAGYSPVGRGGEHSIFRGFHCFHDSCADKTIHDYLEILAIEGAPQVPVKDVVADLVADYAFLTSEDSVVRIRGVNNPTTMKIGAFRNAYPRNAVVYEQNGKAVTVPESKLWLTAPNRLTIAGRRYDPTSNSRITKFDNQSYLNTFTHPSWGKGSYDKEDIERFNGFVKFLIPSHEERDYFIQWLAAKAQNVCFKGAAILMVAPTQGTGRTTLTDMVAMLFQHENVKKVSFPSLCAAGEAGSFNDWQESIIVTCDEVMTGDKSKYKVYEGLKDLFDPKPKQTLVNTKYGSQRQVTLFTSYLLLTNHTDAVGALADDRRVYVIQNTISVNTPRYYASLNTWIATLDEQGTPKWARSVWRWLQTLTPDVDMLNSPAPMTAGKLSMIEDTSSLCDVLPKVIFNDMGPLIAIPLVCDIASDILFKRTTEEVEPMVGVIKRKCTTGSQAMVGVGSVKPLVKINGTVYRLRVTHDYMKSKSLSNVSNIPEHELAEMVEVFKQRAIEAVNKTELTLRRVNAVLDEKGL